MNTSLIPSSFSRFETNGAVGTDEEPAWNTLTGLKADERAMVAQVYRQSYSVSLLDDINGDFSDNFVFGKELEKTLKLNAHGGLTLAERIYYAIYGWGTDDPEIHRCIDELSQMSYAQVVAVEQEYRVDLVTGGANGLLAAMSLPSAARVSGTRFGVLRAIGSNPFANGAVVSGLSATLNQNTWQQGGFAVGIVNIVQASALGGFGASVLCQVPGAVVHFAQTTGLTSLTRTIMTTTGREVVQLYNSTFNRLIRQAIATGRTWLQAVTDALPNLAERVDALSNRFFSTTANETATTIRQWIRTLLENENWGGPQLGLVTEAGVAVWESSRGEFATLGVQGIRDRLLASMQAMYMSMGETVDGILGRLTALGAGTATREMAEALAERLGNLENIDDAAIRQALENSLPAGQAISDDLVRGIRDFLAIRRSFSRVRPHLETGNLNEGWLHIEARHLPPNGTADLFAAGTTRAQIEAAAVELVDRGTRISDPARRIQVYEQRMSINGKSARYRVVVDGQDGNRVITLFPVEGGS